MIALHNLASAPFSFSWGAMGAPLANHVWQSTLFAGAAALLALLLKGNRAQVRYRVWLVASLKFLIPFSILVGMGSHLAWRQASTVQPEFGLAMQQINEPFAAGTASPAAAPGQSQALPGWAVVSKALLGIWFCGMAVALLSWLLRWRRIALAMRGAAATQSGREVEMVRRLEKALGSTPPLKVIISDCRLEPGIVGVFRPTLLLPSSVSERLTDVQLESVILHELWHVRRRDNLAAAIHMAVAAAFWFHPLVWWIGARLVDERERACDEQVIAHGSEPQVYAESILRVCEFYVESPLLCAAGVTGSNLKKRIEEIMLHRIARKLNFAKKALLAAVGVAAIALPVAIGMMKPAASHAQSQSGSDNATFVDMDPAANQAQSGSDRGVVVQNVIVTSTQATDKRKFIRRQPDGSFTITNFSLNDLIGFAYGLSDSQITGGPAWTATQGFDIGGKVSGNVPDIWFRGAIQEVLADTFRLVFHRDTKQAAVYELVIAKTGSKLTPSSPAHENDKAYLLNNPNGHIVAEKVGMAALVSMLTQQSKRLVVDKTELKGTYNFTLNWMAPADFSAFNSAIQEQLGLELQPASDPVEMFVIDDAEEVGGSK